MLSTLRWRLIISHVLPLLVIMPLIGLALVYLLESQVVLPILASEVADKARLSAEMAATQPSIWTDPVVAKAFVLTMTHDMTERITLLDTSGRVLASSSSLDADRVGTVISVVGLADAINGKASVYTVYSQTLHSDVVDAFVPVKDADGQIVGLIRLSHSLSSIYDRFLHQRYLIALVLTLGLLLGGTVGWLLALDLERPLRLVTKAVVGFTTSQEVKPVPEQGPAEVRLLAHSFNAMVDQLTGLEQARRQLLANLVHELGRPLGALHSAIQALMGGAAEQAELRSELLIGMDGEVGRLRRLLDDLARLRDELVGTLELSRHPVSVSGWLPQVLGPWREAAYQKGLRWQSTIPGDLPTMTIDPDRLAQAVGNLVSNAIKYTSSGGQVSVAAGQRDGSMWIRVGDSGPGIAADEQDRIFTPFYRIHDGRRFPQGMGLGLSIARSLISAHGGRIELRSAPGQGSDFTIWIPLG